MKRLVITEIQKTSTGKLQNLYCEIGPEERQSPVLLSLAKHFETD